MTASEPSLVIAGGGLAGCLAALAIAERRPDVRLLLLEGEEKFGGNHVWSFFDGDVAEDDAWLVASLIGSRWADHEVRFPRRSRTLHFGYNSIHSDKLDEIVRARLRPEQYRLRARIVDVAPNEVLLENGETVRAEGLIDARGAANLQSLDLGWQKFVGRTFNFKAPHGSQRPVIMDAQVDQGDGYRFVYTLPFSANELLVEDTYYSETSEIDLPLLRERIGSYMMGKNWQAAQLTGEETGVLPVTLGGDIDGLWSNGPTIARLGLRGGFFHPTTGYSLLDAVRNAALLAAQADLSTAALHQLFHDRATMLWKERGFYRMLNRMLFKAASPPDRYRVLEHFYRLPEAVVGRFYAGRSTPLDKLRILSGKPPVPLRKALGAMREKSS
jgi:lycopene beta-cyclase